MQWLRTVDSSLHSTFAKPRHRTLGSSLHTSPFPRVRHRTVQHCTALCTQQPCTVLWPAACTALCTAPLPDIATALDSSLHSTAPCQTSSPLQHLWKFLWTAPSRSQQACCVAFARPRQPAARCTARFPDFATAANSSQPQPAQHLGQHSTSARLRHRTVSSSLTAGLHSTLHSTFARPRHRSLNTSLHTTMRRTTAQHLCQTLPPHSQQPAQHPAQHLCQTSPQSPPPKTSPLRSKNPYSFQLSGE